MTLVPKIPSMSSPLTSVPTVEEIEAAAFYGDGGIAPKPAPTQSSILLDQLLHPWSLKQQSRPVSSSFGDFIHPTPSSRDLLERESSVWLYALSLLCLLISLMAC